MGFDDRTAKVYGMVKNIDDNLGKLLAKLKALGLDENTIVIFLCDNGPNGKRFTMGLRGAKGSVYEGGIRTGFFLRWPARFQGGRKVDLLAAHIDVAPTLLAACGVAKPQGVTFDGMNMLPWIVPVAATAPPNRTIYIQWHRGDAPVAFRACAARGQRWKLVNGKELYDLQADPGEKKNVAAEHPDIVKQMRAGYEAWLKDVSATRGYDPPRIHIGTPHENPTTLTRQDWRGPRASWRRDGLGYWAVKVVQGGAYEITLRFRKLTMDAPVHVQLGDVKLSKTVEKGASTCVFDNVELKAGDGRLEAWVTLKKKPVGVQYVDVKRLP